ncbi:hygromycin-B 4-O-kinase [Stackebrandtia albiflava]|uniref:Hygromycin-B 4-O-kinase n=1 Tax=Stackebrandtia albiflava TaxID=406432 RepID=A0A562V430_9ACTN|nr:aminoglycoside phosphotransferase family protein [Stackebrandtia albiflava]TWJ12636.1 hygromycin-B 4-O-kinase [Stackebrandtia albiflava]
MTKPRLDRHTVQAALEDRYGPVTLTPMVEGEESQAFSFDHHDTPHVVRVNPRARGFHKDAWAARHLGHRIPVPAVDHIAAVGEHHMCVSLRLPGHTVKDVTDPTTLAAVTPRATEALHHVNAVDMSHFDGYGDFDPLTGETSHRHWRDVVTGHAPDLTPHEGHLDVALARRHHTELHDLATGLPTHRRLIHGDYGADNLLIHHGHVSGVIDWEAAMIGDPLYDLANLRFWAPFLPCMKAQADHMEAHLTEPDAVHRIRCYLLAVGLRATGYYAAAGQLPIAQAMLMRLRNDRP